MFSEEQVRQQAHVHVVSKALYTQEPSGRTPVPYGPLDHRMVCTRILVPTVYNIIYIFHRSHRVLARRVLHVRHVTSLLQTVLVTMVTSTLSYLCFMLVTSGALLLYCRTSVRSEVRGQLVTI